MIVTHKMEIDLVDKPGRRILDVIQGDSVRVLEIALLEQGKIWQIPENLSVIIRYDKADGTGGCYDTLPDGTQAWQVNENKLHIALAPALCSTKGYVTMQIALIQGLEQISTFVMQLDVEAEVCGEGEAEDYINLSNWLSIHGQAGPEGKSAYEIAVKNGYEGTEEAWVASLRGEKGNPGANGQNGADGYTPVKGTDYWTEADKAEMVADVIVALPVYGGEVIHGTETQMNDLFVHSGANTDTDVSGIYTISDIQVYEPNQRPGTRGLVTNPALPPYCSLWAQVYNTDEYTIGDVIRLDGIAYANNPDMVNPVKCYKRTASPAT